MRPSPSLALRLTNSLAHVAHLAHPARHATQKSVRAAYYRGGTSRAVFFHPPNLPRDRALWPQLFADVMGSGDVFGRQLDGMGAGVSSLSKICLVEKHTAVDADADADAAAGQERIHVDYTFVGMGIEDDTVDVAGNCGNMTSAVGPYAYNARLLPASVYAQQHTGPVSVRIRNTNTAKLITATFDVVRGQAAVVGDCTIDGVSGSGAPIRLDFDAPYGSKTGRVLPTGNRIDRILDHRVTCVDGANPCVFIRAADVGIDGTILPADFAALPDKLALLDRIRRAAAVAMGIAPTPRAVPRTIPKIGLVSMSAEHRTLAGHTLHTAQADLVVRFLSDGQPHRAVPLTAALTTAVAARIPGTLVEQLLAPDPVAPGLITIAHPSGCLQVNATMHHTDPTVPVNATVYRTAKRLFEGHAFWLDGPRHDRYGAHGTHSLGMAFVLEARGQSTDPLFGQDVKPLDPELEALGVSRVRKYSSTHRLEHSSTKTTTPTQHSSTQHSPTQHTPTQHSSTQHPPTQHTPTQHSSRQHPPTQHPPTQHPPTQHPPPQHPPTQHPPSQHSSTQHPPPQHPNLPTHPWHAWAKRNAHAKKSLRNAAKQQEKKRKQLLAGVQPTTRRQLGIDKWGRTYASILAKRARRNAVSEGEPVDEGQRDSEVEREVDREMNRRHAEREERWSRRK